MVQVEKLYCAPFGKLAWGSQLAPHYFMQSLTDLLPSLPSCLCDFGP